MTCQLKIINELGIRNSWYVVLFQKFIRSLQKVKMTSVFLKNKAKSLVFNSPEHSIQQSKNIYQIKRGDTVRVKSKNEIDKTLDCRGKYKGCSFVGRMYEHCGKTYKVFKEVEYFYDEAKQKTCKSKNIVLLEGALCNGHQRLFFRSCDRSCFYFWHKEWIERIE